MQHPQPDASITVGDVIKILDENTNGKEVKTVLF